MAQLRVALSQHAPVQRPTVHVVPAPWNAPVHALASESWHAPLETLQQAPRFRQGLDGEQGMSLPR
jgi:hypothetical protein